MFKKRNDISGLHVLSIVNLSLGHKEMSSLHGDFYTCVLCVSWSFAVALPITCLIPPISLDLPPPFSFLSTCVSACLPLPPCSPPPPHLESHTVDTHTYAHTCEHTTTHLCTHDCLYMPHTHTRNMTSFVFLGLCFT